jgi:hypothetical protein
MAVAVTSVSKQTRESARRELEGRMRPVWRRKERRCGRGKCETLLLMRRKMERSSPSVDDDRVAQTCERGRSTEAPLLGT